jgi:hypothetical protein
LPGENLHALMRANSIAAARTLTERRLEAPTLERK